MKKFVFLIGFLPCFANIYAQNQHDARKKLFDADWLFLKDSISQEEASHFDESKWRMVNLPHDWSIEDLPNQTPDTIVGPFDRKSIGQSATGFTDGGTAWYRKIFNSQKSFQHHFVSIEFDGVYMNSDVWLNGHFLGYHPYGYTPFSYDLTEYLKPEGEKNIITVRVRNMGKNSRWYSGSGIYRHVWISVKEAVHIDHWGISVTTPVVTTERATLRVRSTLKSEQKKVANLDLVTTIYSPENKIVGQTKKIIHFDELSTLTDSQDISVPYPELWSVEKPQLYKMVTELRSGDKTADQLETVVGIRSTEFNGEKGFLLNGKRIVLKGGCIHHDNGPLGAAAIDRAEERKIELLKKAGYNAIRLSHNPPSNELLNACDRLGMLVIDEAFDMWNLPKNPQDYHLYFKEWSKKDLETMILRDRNHPSVMMWSIGNEIYEAPDSAGPVVAKELCDEVRRLDPTRPVTEAMVFLPPYTKKPWEDYEPHLALLNTDGYNYFLENGSDYFVRDSLTAHRFETEHAKHPEKTYMVTEYSPASALENWEKTEKYSYLIGSFKWTAMDYIGEAGIGRPMEVPASRKLPTGLMRMGLFYRASWSVYNAYCGDLDLIGDPKAAHYYQSVVWGNSPVEMLVHRPVADGLKEVIAPWGFLDEWKSWTWPGQEGKKIQVHVYARGSEVRLELNGKEIARQSIPDHSITANFEIEYQPGTLVAKSFDDEKQTGSDTLITSGKPMAIRLIADRRALKADLNDLSFVRVEIVDEKGNPVPSADDLEITYQLIGNATIAGVGNGKSDDASSFQQNHKKVFHGRGLVILRPTGNKGSVTLKATANYLKSGSVQIIMN